MQPNLRVKKFGTGRAKVQSRIELTHHKTRTTKLHCTHTHTHTLTYTIRNTLKRAQKHRLSQQAMEGKTIGSCGPENRRRPQIVAKKKKEPNTERPATCHKHSFLSPFFVVTFNLAQARHISEIHLVFIMTKMMTMIMIITIITMIIMIKAGQKSHAA